MCETAPNLALDSIVIVDGRMTVRKDFVLWYLRQFGVKRLRRDNPTFLTSLLLSHPSILMFELIVYNF